MGVGVRARKPLNRVGPVTIRALQPLFPRRLRVRMDAHGEVHVLRIAVAAGAVHRLDAACVRELGRVEPFMTGDTAEVGVDGFPEHVPVDGEGDLLPAFRHGQALLAMTCQAFLVRLRDKGG